MSLTLYRTTITELAGCVPTVSEERKRVWKWWYMELLRLLISNQESYYSIVGEAVYSCIVPLWEKGYDPWQDILESDAVDILPQPLSISLVNMYSSGELGYNALARLLLPFGRLSPTETSLNADEYEFTLNDGFNTIVEITVYGQPAAYKPNTSIETLGFNRSGWILLTATSDSYAPKEIAPLVTGGDTVECCTNKPRTIMNLLTRIRAKEFVVLPNPDMEVIEDLLDHGWTTPRDHFIVFSRTFPADRLCGGCRETIVSDWAARHTLRDEYYHPCCVPLI